jgi:IS5 family transposase
MARQPGFFDADERLRALSAAGDPLERLRSVVDFELFRPELEAALDRSDRSRGGRPPYDAVLMFRVLVLQTLYTPSDDQTEYQLRGRLSFMRFTGLALHDGVPDAKHALGQAKPDPGDDLAVPRAADAQRHAGPAVRAL